MRSKPDNAAALTTVRQQSGSSALSRRAEGHPRSDYMNARSMIRLLALWSILLGAGAQAAVSITAATGGTNISADRAQNGAASAFTTLGDIAIQEGATGDFASASARTLILTVPSGWQFNSGVGTATATRVSGSGANEVSVNSISITANTITVTYTVSG